MGKSHKSECNRKFGYRNNLIGEDHGILIICQNQLCFF